MTQLAHRPLPYRLLPLLRADNAEVVLHPDDRRLGMLLVGSQGSGKSACLLRAYLNDTRDGNAAPIVLDPKSELARLCLRLTPPHCGKRVWFLDLGHPAFGMSPLRLRGEGGVGGPPGRGKGRVPPPRLLNQQGGGNPPPVRAPPKGGPPPPVPAPHPAALRQAGVVSRPRPPRVRDEPTAPAWRGSAGH